MSARRVSKTPRPVYSPNRHTPQSRRVVLTADRAKIIFKYGLIMALALIIYGYFNIRSVSVVGAQHLSEQSLVDAAQASLSRHFLESNLLTIRPGELADDMMVAEYRVKHVDVRRAWPNRLVVTVEERQPSLNWQTGGVSYLLDIDGSIIGPSGNNTLPTVIDNANLPVQKGDKVAPVRFVQFTSELAGGLLAKTGLKVTEMRVVDTTGELYVKTDKGYILKFDTTRGAEGQLSDLQNVLATLAKQKKTPAEYIDLRVENKAYWR